jgi:hypothetical protein
MNYYTKGWIMKAIASEIKERLASFVDRMQQPVPCHSNWASELGHKCNRYLYHMRADWVNKDDLTKKQQQTNLEIQDQKHSMIHMLFELGFKLSDLGKSVALKEHQITGRIDGFIIDNKMKLGFMIKPVESYVFDSIKTTDDLCDPTRPWLERYLDQMTLYMAMTHQSSWLLILKNKSRLDIEIIEYDFVLNRYERLIEKARIVNKALEEKQPPAGMPYSRYHCNNCPFLHLCDTDYSASNSEFEQLSDPEEKVRFDQYFALKEAADKFEELREELKAEFSGRKAIVGEEYKVDSKLVEVKPDADPKPRKGYKYWNLKIIRL